MTGLGPTERRLLRALRAADEPTNADRARVRARIMAKVALAAGAGAAIVGSSATAAGTALPVFGAGAWKVGVVVVAVIGGVGGTAWMAASWSENAPAVAVQRAAHDAPEPALRAQTRAAVTSAPRTVEHETSVTNVASPRGARDVVTTKRPGATRQAPTDLDRELALLEQAQQALKQGDSERALAELDKHATEHPTGALAVERAAIRAVALCESGNVEGQREARRFLARNARSPLAVRVRAACLAAKK